MKRSQKGFTLVELIIVIAVIGVLAAILIPVFANVIKKANAKSALSDARNAVSLYVAEATDRMTRGENVPEHITLLVKKAGKYYVFGYDFNVSQSIQVSNVNDEGGIEAADFNALVSGHSWNGLHAGTNYDPTADTSTYTIENDGAFYLVPYDNNGVSTNTNIRGFITSGGEKYRRLDDAEEFNLSVGNSTEVYHGCLVGASFTYASTSTGGSGTGDNNTTPSTQTYTVTLDLNDVDVPGYTTRYTVNEGDTFSCNTPSAQGKTFNGWKNGTEAVTLPITVTGDVTLTAQWSDVTHTITIDPTWSGNDITITGIPAEFNGGYTYDAPEGTNLNDIIGVLDVSTTLTGKDFLGWTINSTAYDSGVAHSLTADVTIAPVYGTSQLSVKFYNGTTEYTALAMTVDYDDEITLPGSPEDDAAGAHFKGWKLNNSGDPVKTYPNHVTTNLEFYLVLGAYEVTFYNYGGSEITGVSVTGDTYTIPTPSVGEWYYHNGWTLSAGADPAACDLTGTYTAAADGITITAARTSKTVTVSYAISGATGTAPANATITLAASRDYTVEAAPTVDDKNFTDYTATTNGVTINAASFNGGDTLTVQSVSSNTSGTITLTANYEDAPQSSVHEIWNEADFRKIDVESGWDITDQDNTFKLMADISFASSISQGLGTSSHLFEATFDGNGHTITGVPLAASGNDSLFYAIGTHGVIKDLTVNWTDTTARYAVGGIASYNSGTIQDCKVTGTIKVTGTGSTRSGGGICYWNEPSGTITGCYVSANIQGSYGLGGIAAQNEGLIEKCGTSGTITPSQYATATLGGSSRRTTMCGGIVSENSGTVDQCWSCATITGNYACNGGLVGYAKVSTSVISNSYFFGYINAGGSTGSGWSAKYYGVYEGGIVGALNGGTIRQCYCIGRVNSGDASISWYTYGYKYADGTWQGNFWHKGLLYQRGTQNTNWDDSNTNPNDSGACGLAADEWTDSSTFVGYNSTIWDFTTPYPTLKNAPVPSGIEVKPYGMSAYVPPTSHNVSSKADFLKIGIDPDWKLGDHYTMTADIDMEGEVLDPRGYNGTFNAFSGKFDGAGHKISNFSFNTSLDCGGLFWSITGTVTNLYADVGANAITRSHVGIIAYQIAQSGKVTKCGAKGTITYTAGEGCLAGIASDCLGTMDQCWADVIITASTTEGYSGILCGTINSNTKISNCICLGSVSGMYVGSVFGWNSGNQGAPKIVSCYSLARMTFSETQTYSNPIGYVPKNGTTLLYPDAVGFFFLKDMSYGASGSAYTFNSRAYKNSYYGCALGAGEFTAANMSVNVSSSYSGQSYSLFETSVWDFSGTYPKLINAAGMSSVTVAPYAG